jgi:hypothetical protein
MKTSSIIWIVVAVVVVAVGGWYLYSMSSGQTGINPSTGASTSPSSGTPLY